MGQDVTVKVGSDNTALETGLTAAKHAVDHFKEHTEESFAELGHEMLAAFALTAVIESVHSLLEEFSKIGDTAERLGISAESVQRLALVAKTSGVEMDALAKTMQKAAKNAVDAIAGNEELAQSFEKLGVETEEFVNAAPEEQLIMLAEGYEKSGQNAETLNAILKALGKSGAEMIPILAKGPEALREELEGVKVASNETVATLKEAGDNLEILFSNMKVYGGEALNWIISRTKALGTGFAAITAYITALPQGLKAAAKAYDEVLDAAAQLQVEEQQRKEDESKKRKPVDTEALASAKKEAEEKKKAEEELSKLKEENAKKEEEARFRNLQLLQKQMDLEMHIAELRVAKPANALDAERNKGKLLDYEKELETVNKEIAKEKEREEKKLADEMKKADQERAREDLKQKKEALKDAEKGVKDLEKARQGSPVDSLRQIGGGLAGVNYRANAARDDMQRQQLDYARQTVDKLTKAVELLEKQSQGDPITTAWDGSF